jgi:hypothetical protein
VISCLTVTQPVATKSVTRIPNFNILTMRSVALYEMLFGLTTLAVGLIATIGGFGDTTLLLTTLISGVLLIGTGLRLQKGWRPGLLTGLIISLLMVAYFGYNYLGENDRFVPNGLLGVMGALSILLILLILVQPSTREREF